jgi:DNA-directed RNA polymerase subunit omega
MARITIEDCLEVVPSRFALVHVTSQRARRLLKGAKPLLQTDNKLVVTALREVAAGFVTVDESAGKKVEVAEEAAAVETPAVAEAAPATETSAEAGE